jgi:hypothetical protein
MQTKGVIEMQAKIKQTSRYGMASLFSGVEFVKREWRTVPAGFEEQARENPLLEIREGKAEKEIVAKQIAEKVKPVMQARLVASHSSEVLRTFGMNEYVKTEWRPIPAGYEASARSHELLEIWEPGQDEPKTAKGSTPPSTQKRPTKKIADKAED